MTDFDAMTDTEFSNHPDTPEKRDYIADVYRAQLAPTDTELDPTDATPPLVHVVTDDHGGEYVIPDTEVDPDGTWHPPAACPPAGS